MRRTMVVAVAGVLALAACSKNSSTEVAPSTSAGPAIASVDIKVTEFAFVMPDTIPAGVTTLHVQNIGGMPHFIEIQSVSGGKTDSDIQSLLSDPNNRKAPPPKWLGKAPMPNIAILSPGQSTDVTVNLPAGTYAAFCWMPDTNGTPHAYLGMHKVFNVTGTATDTTLPADDFTRLRRTVSCWFPTRSPQAYRPSATRTAPRSQVRSTSRGTHAIRQRSAAAGTPAPAPAGDSD